MGTWGQSCGDTRDGGSASPTVPAALLWLAWSKEPPVPMSQDSRPPQGPAESPGPLSQLSLSDSHSTLCFSSRAVSGSAPGLFIP